jgi:hypothetical protein
MKKGADKNILDVMRIVEHREGKAVADELFGHNQVYPDYLGFDIALPDVIGYRQHSSECVSDSIQQTLLFADVLREFTQPMIYNMTPQQMDVRSKLVLKYTDWDRFNAYFEFIQKRFRSHYDVINYLRTHKIRPRKYHSEYNEVCKLNPIFHRKRAHSAEAGILALKKLKREHVYTETGFPVSEIFSTLKSIVEWLHVPFEIRLNKDIDLSKTVGIIMNFNTGFVKADGSVYWRMSSSHETSFLKMQNNWYFYDNEVGFQLVDEALVEEFIHPKSESEADDIYVVSYSGNRYFVKGGLNPTHEWKNGRWSTDLGRFVTVRGNFSIYVSLMKPVRKYFYGISMTNDAVPIYNMKQCKFTDGSAPSAEEAIATMKTIIECIHSNTHKNSSIFEDLYHYMYDNLDFLQSDHELFGALASTLDTIVYRPACTPMIHYWVHQIKLTLKKQGVNTHEWFEIPAELKRLELQRTPKETPPERREEIRKLEEEREKRMELIQKGIDPEKMKKVEPCPPGQVRNAKTKLCRERAKRTKKNSNEPKEKREKLSPCPPGQVRDNKTRKCRPRLAKTTPCPPGQIRDKKTKKCRDIKKYKLHE